MHILILPYCKDDCLQPIVEAIKKDKMEVFVEQTKRDGESATTSYSIENNKFVISKESGIKKSDIIKQMQNDWEILGNGMSSGSINKKLCSWIICYKDADLSDRNIKDIEKFIEIEKKRQKIHGK